MLRTARWSIDRDVANGLGYCSFNRGAVMDSIQLNLRLREAQPHSCAGSPPMAGSNFEPDEVGAQFINDEMAGVIALIDGVAIIPLIGSGNAITMAKPRLGDANNWRAEALLTGNRSETTEALTSPAMPIDSAITSGVVINSIIDVLPTADSNRVMPNKSVASKLYELIRGPGVADGTALLASATAESDQENQAVLDVLGVQPLAIVNLATQATADVIGLVAKLTVGPASIEASLLASSAFFVALVTNSFVIKSDIDELKEDSPPKAYLAVTGDVVTLVGDVSGLIGSFANAFEASEIGTQFLFLADGLTVYGEAISLGIVVLNTASSPFKAAQNTVGLLKQLAIASESSLNLILGASGQQIVNDFISLIDAAGSVLSAFGTANFADKVSAFSSMAGQLKSDVSSLINGIVAPLTDLTATDEGGAVVVSNDANTLDATVDLGQPSTQDSGDFGSSVVDFSNPYAYDTLTIQQDQSISATGAFDAQTAVDGITYIEHDLINPTGAESQVSMFDELNVRSPTDGALSSELDSNGNVVLAFLAPNQMDDATVTQNPDGSFSVFNAASEQILQFSGDGSPGLSLEFLDTNSGLNLTLGFGGFNQPDQLTINADQDVLGVTQVIAFGDGPATLTLADPADYTGTISNLLPGDSLVFQGVDVSKASIDQNDDLVVIGTDGSSFSLKLDPGEDYAALSLIVYTDDSGEITVVASAPPPSDAQTVSIQAPVLTYGPNGAPMTTIYTANVALSGTVFDFAPQRTDDPGYQELPLTVSYAGGSPDPNAVDDGVNFDANTGFAFLGGDPYAFQPIGPTNPTGTLYIETGTLAGDFENQILPLTGSYDNGSTTIDLTINRKLYDPAIASYSVDDGGDFFDIGSLHVGDTVNVNVQVTNAATGALSDTLRTSAGASGEFSAENGLSLAPGQTGSVTVRLNAQEAGEITANPDLLQPTTHDADLPDEVATSNDLIITASIYNYADPVLAKDVIGVASEGVGNLQPDNSPGSGIFTQSDDNIYSLDFGSIVDTDLLTNHSADIEAQNAAPIDDYSDMLSGTLALSGDGILASLTQGPLFGVEAGAFDELGQFAPDLQQLGSHTLTLVYHPTSYNSPNVAVLPDITLEVTDDIVLPNIANATVSTSGNDVTVIVDAGQTAVIDPLLSGAAAIEVLTIQGPGIAEVDESETVQDFKISLGGGLLLNGGSIDTSPTAAFNPTSNPAGITPSVTASGGTLNNAGVLEEIGAVMSTVGAVVTNAASGTISATSGALSLTAALSNAGDVVADTGGEVILGTITDDTGQITIGSAGAIEFSVTTGANVAFESPGGKLILAAPTSYAGTILNFQAGDTIELPGTRFSSMGTVQIGPSNLLNVVEGSTTLNLQLDPSEDFSGATPHLVQDMAGSDDITLSGVTCFAAGTLIRSERGDVAVEALRIGDFVVAVEGGENRLRPVGWVGRRRVDMAVHPNPERVRPVRFGTGSLGNGLPSSPMVLSPDHGLFLDGGLVPARLLINGASIASLDVPEVTYFHVELRQHAILLAHGVPSESYLDTGNRAQFDNGGGAVALHPNFARGEHPGACAPLVTDAIRVRPLWERFAALADVAPPTPHDDRDPALTLELANGTVVTPRRTKGGCYAFLLHGRSTAGAARLQSRSAVPTDLYPWLDDRRRLGVGVGDIVAWTQNGTARRQIPLDDDSLAGGWWGVERNDERAWRWTDGNAEIDLPHGCVHLEVIVCCVAEYASPRLPSHLIGATVAKHRASACA